MCVLLVTSLFSAQAGESGFGRAVPSAAQSASPSPTPSESPSASPSPTPSASPSSSPSPTPTPAPTPTADPDYRRITLSVSQRRVQVGDRIRLTGRVRANRVECSAASRVTIRQLIFGTSRPVVVDEMTTGQDGRFRSTQTVRWSSAYSAVALRGKASCRREESDPVPVYASVRVGARVSDSTPQRFTNFHIRGRVRPNHADTRVLLQRKRGDRWVTVQRQELLHGSSYSFFPDAQWAGRRVFRVKWPQADRDHAAGVSRKIPVTTHD